MAANITNIPNLEDMIKVEFNPQDLYNLLTTMVQRIENLEKTVQELKDASNN